MRFNDERLKNVRSNGRRAGSIMTKERPTRVVRLPTDEETKAAFERYTLALGKVVHAWNYLHEKLGQLFVVLSGSDRNIALAIWYSTINDRAQRLMLRAAVMASGVNRWPNPSAKDDTIWLLDRADELADQRNNAIHAPCSLYIGGAKDGGAEMGAAYFNGHPRARKLKNKSLLIEFDWCERYAETLSKFTLEIETGLAFAERYPWPDKPCLPVRGDRGGPSRTSL
jgi:hypothetical protein